ncbi:tyrosine protein phosphatase 1 [Botryosphaeria dothidea]
MSTSSPLEVPGSPASSKRSISRDKIGEKFESLGWQERKRLAEAALQSNSPSRWHRITGNVPAQRNRYMNVDPFAANRVQLKVPEGHDDYINASPIELRATQRDAVKKYVATQLYEAGREKCFQYFPDSLDSPHMVVNEHDEFGDSVVFEINLISVSEDERSRSTVRELEVKDRASGETKKVWHILWPVWPDFGVPEGAHKHMLASLIPLSREKNASETNPRIVHCSAGVGRSGTFIALDHLLSELAEGALDEVPEGKDPVEETVDSLRTQRMMMVQQETQLALIYETLRDKWIDRWREREGLPPLKRITGSDRGSSEEGGAESGAGAEAKRSGGIAEADERDAKVARFASELEAELRQNAAAA